MNRTFQTLLSLSIAFIFFFNPCHADGKKFKIGVSLPLSGMAAGMGEAFRNGITLFGEKSPEAFSELEIIYDDHAYDGKKVLSSIQFLSGEKSVDAMIVWGNMPVEVAAPVLAQKKLPTIGVAMDGHGKGKENLITMGPAEAESTPQIKAFFDSKDSKSPAVITVNAGNALAIMERLKALMPELEFLEFVATDLSDFLPLIQKMKAKQSDALLAFLLPEQSLNFAKQAKRVHFDIPVLGPDIWAEESLLKELNASFGDVSALYGRVTPEFRRDYKDHFQTTSFVFEAATAFESMKILSEMPKGELQNQNFKSLLRDLPIAGDAIPGLELQETDEMGLFLRCEAEAMSSAELLAEEAPEKAAPVADTVQ